MSVTVALETLGCKVNQYESSYLLENLKSAGYQVVPFGTYADIYVVHGCGVTSKAAYQARQLLRRAHRRNPEAVIVAAGCQALIEAPRLLEEGLATHILGNDSKYDLTSHILAQASFASPYQALDDMRAIKKFRCLPIHRLHTGRTRAYLKIQDGCDAFCTYCVVPFVRGRSRSLDEKQVRTQLDRFLDAGYREIVLTGIHLGQWGKDLDPPKSLIHLLKFLEKGGLPERLRLSSLEPMECSEELIGYLKDCSWICHHFHIPLQSADSKILTAMGRPYTPKQYSDLIVTLRKSFPDAAIGADVLVGFPGESETHFQNTCAMIDSIPLTYLHAFPFSARPGTAAARLGNRVPGPVKKERIRILRELSTRKRMSFQNSFLGRCVNVLIEGRRSDGWWRGTSDNYLQVCLPPESRLDPGTIVSARISAGGTSGLIANPIPGST